MACGEGSSPCASAAAKASRSRSKSSRDGLKPWGRRSHRKGDMRTLVVGAGATGGYFGGRLLEAGRDVTFLVRPARAERLAASGLAINSSAGNVTLASPPTILAAELRTPFDAVILSCKAYDLGGAIES